MRFNVTKIAPDGMMHHQGFDQIIDSLTWSLSALGHEVNTTYNFLSEHGEHNVIFGAELIADFQRLPKNTTIFNLEQSSHPNMEKVRRMAKQCTVWDYSSRAIEEWRAAGQERVVHVPIGYTTNLTRIPHKATDIDVLFYGWLTPRRVAIIEELKRVGLRVVSSAGCYGGGRDHLISRAKVVLNVHHDGRDRFEIVRCSYLMANGKLVVSELSSDDDEYSDLKNGLAIVPYRLLSDTCHAFCVDSANREREAMGTKALLLIQQRDFTETVRCALESMPLETSRPVMSRPMEFKAQRKEFRDSYMESAKGIISMNFADMAKSRAKDRFSQVEKSGDMKDFVPFLRGAAKGNILEIGVRDGASTSAFLLGVEEHGGHVYSVDIEDCGKLFANHPQWTFIQADSKDVEGLIKKLPQELDLILIDGDHTRAGVINDLSYAILLKPGGMIVFHDIAPEPKPSGCMDPTWPTDDVKNVYFDLCSEMSHLGWTSEVIPGRYGLGVLRKPPVTDIPNLDLSWYPQLPESMMKGKTPEEIESARERILDYMAREIFK